MAMKRKLNVHDAPEAESLPSPKSRASDAIQSENETTSADTPSIETTAIPKPATAPSKKSTMSSKEATATSKEATASFADFELEPRLLRGIRDQRWNEPTAVQAKAIPLAIDGRDVLARSGTGTGKTAAYLLPILHKTLRQKGKTSLILVPTKELALQITKVAKALSIHCGQEIRIQNIAGKESEVVTKAKLADKPDIVIATPARASANINNGALVVTDLAHLVVDESDLVYVYMYEVQMRHILTLYQHLVWDMALRKI